MLLTFLSIFAPVSSFRAAVIIISNTFAIAFVLAACFIQSWFKETSFFVFTTCVSIITAAFHAFIISQSTVSLWEGAARLILGPALSIANDLIIITTEVVLSWLTRMLEVRTAHLVLILTATKIFFIIIWLFMDDSIQNTASIEMLNPGFVTFTALFFAATCLWVRFIIS